MALFQHGSAAFGAYLGSLIALFFLLPPSPRVITQVPDINPNLGFLVDFFGGWVYRGDGGQNAIFLAVLCLILLGTSFLCSPSKNAGIAGLVTFLGEFFHIYLSFKYAPAFFATITNTSLLIFIINPCILIAAAVGWSMLVNLKVNPKTPPPQDKWTTVTFSCPSCGATFKSNPKYCSECSTQLRD